MTKRSRLVPKSSKRFKRIYDEYQRSASNESSGTDSAGEATTSSESDGSNDDSAASGSAEKRPRSDEGNSKDDSSKPKRTRSAKPVPAEVQDLRDSLFDENGVMKAELTAAFELALKGNTN